MQFRIKATQGQFLQSAEPQDTPNLQSPGPD